MKHTAEEILIKAKSCIEAEVALYDVAIDKLSKDYNLYFSQYAEQAYCAKFSQGLYQALVDFISEQPESAEEWVLNYIREVNDALKTRKLSRNSSNQLSNMAHIWELECKQEFLEFLERANGTDRYKRGL